MVSAASRRLRLYNSEARSVKHRGTIFPPLAGDSTTDTLRRLIWKCYSLRQSLVKGSVKGCQAINASTSGSLSVWDGGF
jgi:hypothetical protein